MEVARLLLERRVWGATAGMRTDAGRPYLSNLGGWGGQLCAFRQGSGTAEAAAAVWNLVVDLMGWLCINRLPVVRTHPRLICSGALGHKPAHAFPLCNVT